MWGEGGPEGGEGNDRGNNDVSRHDHYIVGVAITTLWVWLYRTEAVELTRPYLYNDSIDDVFEREPYSILVTSKTLGMRMGTSCYDNKNY